jgi:hypothetical protein
MRRILIVGPFILALVITAFGSPTLSAQRGPGGAGGGQADPWPNLKKLLAVADVQSGFHHDSISHALATVEQIGPTRS